ncbi:polyol transporter 5-like [Scaptodrosophila lebanonensis]|uniref:Polyol transporter 5-like n=1 Tax=Drosophila lebanonensis TaxID=7225 RepID=A0A6J2T7E7_DROLE|nr:polyol transporter 5-like [Scaptodrosophila lebanonensis]
MNDNPLKSTEPPTSPPGYGLQPEGPPTNAPAYGFAQNYPPQGYPQNYPPQGYPQNYPPAVPANSYPPPNYPPAQPPPQGYPGQSYQGAQVYPPQSFPPQHYGPPPVQPSVAVVPPGGWYSRNQRNKPQSNAVGAAALIFASGGMNIAFSAGFFTVPLSYHTRICWFIGAIIGTFISSILVNQVPKKVIFAFASLLVIVGGVLFACDKNVESLITAGLYLDGIANGLVFAPTLALAGEVAVFYMRGTITTTIEQASFGIGFFLQIVYASTWEWNVGAAISAEQIHGILSAVFGVIGVIIAAFLTIESPVIMLANGEEQAAIDTLRRLQRPYTLTTETYDQLAEHKRYVEQNKDISVCAGIVEALPAFLRLIFLRALNAMSMCQFTTYAFLIASAREYRGEVWPIVLFGLCRWLGNLVTAMCTECVGRKKLILLGLLVCTGMGFGTGSQFYSSYYYWPVYYFGNMEMVMTFLCLYQVFAGVAFTPTSAYLSEAFPLGVKQHMIGLTFIVEMLVFIIISVGTMDFTTFGVFFYFVGGLSVFGFIAGIWLFPETKGTNLRQSQDKFRGFLSFGF